MCLQETFSKDTDNITVRGFNLYHKCQETSAGVSNTNMYVMTFSCASLLQDIKAGYHNIKAEVYVLNPLRCYTCQRYGHGAMRCTNGHICHRCGGDEHEGFDCKETPFCCNCKSSHMASSKECPIWIQESVYSSSRLPTIVPSSKHVHFISVKTSLQHKQPQTLMQQQHKHHAPSRVLLARQRNLD